MSEKKKKNPPQEEQPQADTAPETEQAAEKAAEEETFTVTREQMEQMEQLAKMVSDASDKYLRLAAEYDNYRKRTTKEKDGIYQDAKGDTIKTFLAVYDNLERAAAAEGGEDDPHKKGLEMIFHQFKELLAKEGKYYELWNMQQGIYRSKKAEPKQSVMQAVVEEDDDGESITY